MAKNERILKNDDNSDTYSLDHWEEIIGVVETINNNSITLRCSKRFVLEVGKESLMKWKYMLKRGALVGILKLDYESFKVRLVKNVLQQDTFSDEPSNRR